MLNITDYDRLKSEYNAGYKKTRPLKIETYKISLTFAMLFAVLTVIGIALLIVTDSMSGAAIIPLTVMLLTTAIFFFCGLRDKKGWEQTEDAIKMSDASYDCVITDCGGYVSGGKSPYSSMVFKFTYNKGGAVITDMCHTWLYGVFKGDIGKARITLYETSGGEKVISVTLQGESENRILCR